MSEMKADNPRVSPAGLKRVSRRMSRDRRYTRKMLSNYDFAKTELAQAGLKLTPKLYSQIKGSYRTLQTAAREMTPEESKGKADITISISVSYSRQQVA